MHKNIYKEDKTILDYMWNNGYLCAFILLVCACILSLVKIVVFPLGGVTTFMSLFFLWLIVFVLGDKRAIGYAFIFGMFRFLVACFSGEAMAGDIIIKGENLLQTITNLIDNLSLPKFLIGSIMEYPLGHVLFCLPLVLFSKIHEDDVDIIDENEAIINEPKLLIIGYLCGVVCLYVLNVISAVVCYEPVKEGILENILYNMGYEFTYLFFEVIISLAFLSISIVRKVCYYIKYVANHEDEDDTLEGF